MTKRSRRHKWDENKIPLLPDHSQAKHSILSGYIQKYLSIVCQSRKITKYNITLIDGFAGGGIYEDNKKGSPLVMRDAVIKSIYDINKNRKKHVLIEPHYFFIEEDPLNYASLKNVISGEKFHNQQVITKNGDFNTYIPDIISHIKKRNPRNGGGAIFFLDQDGYAAVDIKNLKLIRKQLPQSEVIINISISWLVDFIDDSDRFKKTISNMGIINFLNINEIIDLRHNIKENRYIIESKLSVAIQRAAKFPYFRPFFIEPDDNHRGYWLLHLSPHFRAHNAMSEVIWENGNSMRHYGGVGTKIFELSYKGGFLDTPDLFGDTFNEFTRQKHLDGLIRDLPESVWDSEAITVSSLIENTCNNTAATQEMYKESLLSLKEGGDILIRGQSGGKKRNNKIMPNDIIIPNKQLRLFSK